jgi:aspartokinase-like uncharacterized kinase
MIRARVSVVKVGGSLLGSADLPRRLRAWLAAEAAAHPDTHFVLTVGGGKLVDAVRELDAQTPLGDERAHWMCVALMDVTAGLVAAMLPELVVVDQFALLEHRLREPGTSLLRPHEFLKKVEPASAGTRLVCDWTVTSDAIAGRLAVVLRADELVLFKSVPPPIPDDGRRWLERLAAAGYVDGFLPTLSAELPAIRVISGT